MDEFLTLGHFLTLRKKNFCSKIDFLRAFLKNVYFDPKKNVRSKKRLHHRVPRQKLGIVEFIN